MIIRAENAVEDFGPLIRALERNSIPGIEGPIEQQFSEGVSFNFENTQDPFTGAEWKPRKDNKRHPLLDLSGAMKEAAKYPQVIATAGLVMFRLLATAVFYAPYQQFGTLNKDGTQRIPPRPYFGLGLVHRAKLKRVITRFIRLRFYRLGP